MDATNGPSRSQGTLLEQCLDLLMPNHCRLCQVRCRMPLCERCLALLPPNLDPRCQRCDLPLGQKAPLCAECLARMPAFSRIICAYRYQGLVPRLITQWKHQRHYHWAPLLAAGLILRLREAPRADLLIPVPLHWRRRWRRGFNQSAMLAQLLAADLDIPLRAALRKTVATPAQQGLDRRQRLRNLRDSFRVAEDVHGRHVAVVDDVITTGATAETLAVALLAAGASEVSIYALARTPKAD